MNNAQCKACKFKLISSFSPFYGAVFMLNRATVVLSIESVKLKNVHLCERY